MQIATVEIFLIGEKVYSFGIFRLSLVAKPGRDKGVIEGKGILTGVSSSGFFLINRGLRLLS